MDPYREGEVVELVVERGACTWCHAEIAYLVNDATMTCKHCGAQVALPQARALRRKLMTEVTIPPVRSVRPAWLGVALTRAWNIACLLGAIGTLGFAALLVVAPHPHPVFAFVGFLLCLPLGVVVLVRSL